MLDELDCIFELEIVGALDTSQEAAALTRNLHPGSPTGVYKVPYSPRELYLFNSIFVRVVPDIRLPAGYPVSFAGYPVKLLNKRCELRKRRLVSEPFQ